MESLSSTDRQQLAASLLLSVPLFEEFRQAKKPAEAWAADKGFKLWCDALEEYYVLWEKLPSPTTFQSMLAVKLAEASWMHDYSDESTQHSLLLKEALRMAGTLASSETPQEIERVGRKLMQNLLFYFLRVKVADQATRGTDLSVILDRSARELATIDGMDGSRFAEPFPGLDLPAMRMVFEPTGIDFIDAFCGGGLLSGECIGHAAPIGSGKTTLVLQVMWARAERLIARYPNVPLDEIPWNELPFIYGFFFERVEILLANFMSNAANIPRTTAFEYLINRDRNAFSSQMLLNYKDYEHALYGEDIQLAKAGKAPPPMGELERFRRVAYITNKLIKLVDFSGGDPRLEAWSSKGVTGMAEYIKAHQHKEGSPGVDVVMLDYVGAMVEIATNSGFYNQADRAAVTKAIPTYLNRLITGPFRCPAWAAHQLNSGQNDREGGTIPNPNKTEGSHMFLENCALGFASGKLTDESVAVYVGAKNRRDDKKPTMLARLDKTYARWVGANDSHVLAEGTVMSRHEQARQSRVNIIPVNRVAGFERMN